ncbi:MAG: hypothetical protein A3D31_08265 [Candidatus Fluviicola riflensis]|nr:MAG: hypothetical protein CHH17_06735 [Candidatus Fluviicola riflensis]OGS79933.1 MAG: hypothetical protein A3D31_08265 [Candidatus Fluviicola riflensis]OGS82448.1 MAG: hypothetical protein A2724_17210 [Fluviicola sp. RIFCSPHIGHO2_01_FULL_43_53]OGS88112.1 MAG: hypothetical protein A3E30_14645 [Fluviicola sp. RIFCSPHIGHO2_12_FULL_43_24]
MQTLTIRHAMKLFFKTLIVTFLFSSFGIRCSAQKQLISENLGCGFSFSPELNNLIIKDKASYQSVQSEFGFSVGAEMNFTLKEKFVFRIGFGCGLKQFTYVNDNVVLNNYYNPELGFINPTVTMSYDIALNEVHVPLLVHYRLFKSFFVGGGVEFIKPFYSPSYYTISGNPDVAFKRTYMSVELSKNVVISASLGYRMKLAESYHLLIEPTFRIYTKGYGFGTDELGANGNNFYSVGLKTTFWIGGK